MMAPLYLSGFLYLTHAFRASHERGHKNEEAYHRAALTFLCLLDCSRNPKLELLHNPRTKQERELDSEETPADISRQQGSNQSGPGHAEATWLLQRRADRKNRCRRKSRAEKVSPGP